MDLNRCNVELEIQELVLVDVPVQDRQGLKASVSVELTRLFQVNGIPGSLRQMTNRAAISTAPIAVSAQENQPNLLGVEIARAIYRGLGG